MGNQAAQHDSKPATSWFKDADHLNQIDGFWYTPEYSPVEVLNNFKPLPNDIILASFPKTGTTWLKALLFSIMHRSNSKLDDSTVRHNPHELIPTFEVQGSNGGLIPDQSSSSNNKRLLATHIPIQLIGKKLDLSDQCRVIYVTRNPKDTLVSLWHFANKWKGSDDEPWYLEEAVEKFCCGEVPYGPYYDHVMGYKMANLENPEKVMFITYEELKADTKTHVKRLAEFVGCPFEKEEDEEEVVKCCSFEILSSHEVNKDRDNSTSWQSTLFRKGVVGDHKNYLSAETVERIDALTKDKFHAAGFMYGI